MLDFQLVCVHILIVQDDVRQPYLFGWYIQSVHPSVLGRLPTKLIIVPFLGWKTVRNLQQVTSGHTQDGIQRESYRK